MAEAGAQIEEMIDFKRMITERLEGDKALLNRLFLDSGKAEFEFIIRSGFHFGFLFGLVQLAVWIFAPSWWVLPTFGLIVGYATNWIALNLIFRPLEPYPIGPWVVQGLFLKRQKEVAAVWCGLVTKEILTVRALVVSMVNGPEAERLEEIIRRNIRPVVDDALGPAGLVADLAVGEERLEELRREAAEVALQVSSRPFDDPLFNKGLGRRALPARADGDAAARPVPGPAASLLPGGRDEADPVGGGARVSGRLGAAVPGLRRGVDRGRDVGEGRAPSHEFGSRSGKRRP